MTALTPIACAPDIVLKGLHKTYGTEQILHGLDLVFKAGELNVILGPSGCGKSTLLRMVAGLEDVSQGQILMGGRDVTRLPPKERGCAMVFQNYALYPHMSVADNIGYALKLARISRKEREQRIRECAGSLGLEALLQRKPGELSGGQRQRVAIGRALIRKPPVLLFDEPLCNLDSALRHEMRLLIRRLHQQTGATILYVTHDQTEAMTLAERVVILNKGHVEQIGTPTDIYDQPASIFVAGFIGTPPMNLLPVHCLDDNVLMLADGQRLPVRLGVASNCTGKWLMGLRPETFALDQTGVIATVESSENLGSHSLLYCQLAGTRCVVSLAERQHLMPCTQVRLAISPAPLLFDIESGQRQLVSFSQTAK
ncbi:ABC transporter ATP-binding protein [Pseudomonas caricapapayae]|uniref:Glycerol-3-phosphate ABC transporter, ATP-binding protein n=1 Tax=Pseudomonas caricapapayae TaxID=46678 RepID=A0A3M3BGH2_9PSED|nr:sn-glycerol-3-phosphate ABC transporter ATP-binding protein UgpC [Pseudomonas caricapapayae]KAA8694106.1 sn-glycerol-3-phosphate ABC transporter ATP-binding protein UgpC [Pseudomonas caricapapayae]RMM11821.1 Glycerol-3-phosphate ABC transporter, ATP-binding protein [Pseudomonas caricapapayae]RMV76957.1 sn-glycerol-3-phosphate transport ATP-binding protein [Pseudomonas caricapapayae]RMV98860.1 sn-glycerol-3-phosphate transport ATP-binding protein [Pseudomonas caricapapayae]